MNVLRLRPMDITAWALALMVAKASPERLAALPAYPGWEETAEERLERYKGIADAAVKVGKTKGRVATLLAISFHESGWARDVDLGPCYRGVDGKSVRCDGGRAACMMQVRTDAHPQWKAEDLFASREECFRVGQIIIDRSERACRRHGPDYAFDVYAGGQCGVTSVGQHYHKKGLELLGFVRDFYRWMPSTGGAS